MQVVGMGGVVIGPERHRENTAATIVDALEEFAFRAAIVPVGLDHDDPAVLQLETGDVDGIGEGVLGPAVGTGDVAAGKTAVSLEAGNRRGACRGRRWHPAPGSRRRDGGSSGSA